MISRDDILSMEYLKKSEFTGCHQGMRYRLEGIASGEGKTLQATVWPEPFSYFKTPEEQKTRAEFEFSDEGVGEAVEWMNSRLSEDQEKWERAWEHWEDYKI